MPAFSTISFSKSGQTLFTPDEVRELMRVEFGRAQRYGYPIACMMVLVDRLDDMQAYHGWESREEILMTVVELLKRETRSSDFLGCLVNDRIVAIFPHTNAEAAGFLAERLLRGTRGLEFQLGDRTLRVTLSVGLSHNQHAGPLSFDTLIRVAEEGLTVADAGGGDQYVETELYQLYEMQRQPGPAEPEPELETERPRPTLVRPEDDPEYSDRLLAQIAQQEVDKTAAIQMAEELANEMAADAIRAAEAEYGRDHGDQEGAYKREIDLLQRRIAKLTQSLDLTEEEVLRLRLLKNVDAGMSSIYREVQGLNAEDDNAEQKRELCAKIFEANLDFRQKSA